jgi:hypothetical protein
MTDREPIASYSIPTPATRAVDNWLQASYEQNEGSMVMQHARCLVEPLLAARDEVLVELPGARVRPVWLRELLAAELELYTTDYVLTPTPSWSMETDLLACALDDVHWQGMAELMLAERGVSFWPEDSTMSTLQASHRMSPTVVIDSALRGRYHGGGIAAEAQLRVRQESRQNAEYPCAALAAALKDFVQTDLRAALEPALAVELVNAMLDEVNWAQLAEDRLPGPQWLPR